MSRKKHRAELNSGLFLTDYGDGEWEIKEPGGTWCWSLAEEDAREVVKFLQSHVINSDDQEMEEEVPLEDRVTALEVRHCELLEALLGTAEDMQGRVQAVVDSEEDSDTL